MSDMPPEPPSFTICDQCGTLSKPPLSNDCLFNACPSNNQEKKMIDIPEYFWLDANGKHYSGNFNSNGEFNGACRYVRADLVPQCPEGWVMVPVEPTEAMLNGITQQFGCFECTATEKDGLDAYKAMLSVAPKPPAGGENV